MKRKITCRRRALSLEVLETRRLLATYYVNIANDDPGVSDCVAGADCSLRSAINESNKYASPHEIYFAIPGDGPHRLMLNSPLPMIHKHVTLDATTQDGIGTGPQIELNGSRIDNIAGSSDSGLLVRGGSTIRGFSIVDFPGYGIYVASGGNTVITGNYIGVRADGVTIAGNGRGEGTGDDVKDGIGLFFSANNQIGGPGEDANLIMGNKRSGILVYGDDSHGNRIQQNSILANGGRGIRLLSDNSGGGTTKPGPNGNQPSPVLTSAVVRNNELTIGFETNFVPNRSFEIEVFYNSADSSAGDATTLLRTRTVLSMSPAVSTGQLTMPFPGPITGTISLTTTDLTTNNTSEISLPIAVTNDNLPQASVLDTGTTEGSDLSFDIHLSRAVNSTVEVLFSTFNDTAVAGSDYLAKTQTVTFEPNQTKKTVTVTTLDNGTADDGEGDETLRVQLSNPVGADLLDPIAIGRILDNDSPPGTLPMGAGLRDLASFMIGKVHVNVVFVESTGFGSDPNLEDWTATQIANQKQDIQAGLDWWKAVFAIQDSQHQLDFEIDWHLADNPLQTDLEFVHDANLKTRDMLVAEMARYYNVSQSANPHTDYRNLLQQQRVEHGTDWVTTIFVLDNSSTNVDLEQIDGGYAESYVIQPADIFRSSTVAHEFGHVFYATDQYGPSFNATATSNLCKKTAGYYNTPNLNSSDCNTPKEPTSPSIMNELSNEAFHQKLISPSTAKMIGWQDTDGDRIFDVLDQPLELDVSHSYESTSNTLQITGSASVSTLINRNPFSSTDALPNTGDDITINRLGKLVAKVKLVGQVNFGPDQILQTFDRATGVVNASLTASVGQSVEICVVDTHEILRTCDDPFTIQPSPALSMSLQSQSIDEATGTSILTVTRAPMATLPTVISIAVDPPGQLQSFVNVTIDANMASGSVTLRPVNDGIVTGDRIVTLSATATGVDPATATLTIVEDDAAALDLSTTVTTIDEDGGSVQLTLTRNTPATSELAVTLQTSPAGQLQVPPTVSFDIGESSKAITVSSVSDFIDQGNRSINLSASASGHASDSLSLLVVDNDTAGLSVSSSAVTVSESGSIATFNVALTSQPLSDVVVSIPPPLTNEVSVNKTLLTFTSANWNLAQTVTVTGLNDAIDDGDQSTLLTISVVDESSDDVFDAVADQAVTVTTTDDDTRGVTVSTISANTSEAGGSATFTVVLESEPTAAVTISLTSNDPSEGSVSATSLQFTPSNWDQAQTVTVTGVNDDIDDGDVGFSIVTGAAVGGDYDTLLVDDVAVVNADDDTAGFTVNKTSAIVSESGTTDTFTVVLDTQPLSNVVLLVGSSNPGEASVDKTSVTFSAANWEQPQTVTVTGVDDDVDDGDQSTAITLSIDSASSDDVFDAVADQAVTVTTTDDDTRGVTVSTISANTSEAGGSATFTVVLESEPTAAVTISLTSSDPSEGSVSATSLQFTPGNWDQAQTVTVTGVNDDIDDGDVGYSIVTGAAVGGDYDTLLVDDVAVVNADDDTPGFVLSKITATVSEAGTSDTFTVVLTTQPTSAVVVGVTSGNPAEATVSPATLGFSPANWNAPQSIAITGIADSSIDGDQSTIVTLSIDDAASDDAFDSVADQFLSVITIDTTVDNRPEITVPASIVVEADAVGGTSETNATVAQFLAGATATDDFDPLPTITHDGGASFALGETLVTFTATDNAGQQDVASATITVVDTTAPLLTVPTPIFVNANAPGGAESSLPAITSFLRSVTAMDIVDPSPLLLHDAPSIFPVGETTVTFTATDVSGNQRTGTAVVNVTDVETPVLVLTLTQASISESGGGTTGTVTRNSSDAELTVTIGTDLPLPLLVPGPIRFGPGVDSVTFPIDVLDDQLVTGDHPVQVIASADGYADVAATLTVLDDDVASVEIVQTDGSTFLTSAGVTDSVSIVLGAQPIALVEVIFQVGTDLVESPPQTLQFDASNWHVPQVVELSLAPGFQSNSGIATIPISIQSSAYGFADLADLSLPVSVVAAKDSDLRIFSTDVLTTVLMDSVSGITLIDGRTTSNVFQTGSGNEVIVVDSLSPSLTINMGDGDDVLQISQSGLIVADGQGGTDTLLWRGESQSMSLETDFVGLRSFEQVNLQQSLAKELLISPAGVSALTDQANRLSVIVDGETQLRWQGDWSVLPPKLENSELVHELVSGNATVLLKNDHPWSNPLQAVDVNRSGDVTPSDILEVLNWLADFRAEVLPIPRPELSVESYVDVSRDGKSSPNDALMVINFLSERRSGQGERIAPAAMSAFLNPVEATHIDERPPADDEDSGIAALSNSTVVKQKLVLSPPATVDLAHRINNSEANVSANAEVNPQSSLVDAAIAAWALS